MYRDLFRIAVLLISYVSYIGLLLYVYLYLFLYRPICFIWGRQTTKRPTLSVLQLKINFISIIIY